MWLKLLRSWAIAKRKISFVSGSFRIDEDRDTVFDLIDGSQDHLHTLADVASIKEKTIHIDHPDIEKRNLEDFLLGNKACWSWNPWISKYDIKDTAVVTNIEDCLICWNIFFADDSSFNAAKERYYIKGPADDGKGNGLLGPGIELTNNQENALNRQTQYQKNRNK